VNYLFHLLDPATLITLLVLTGRLSLTSGQVINQQTDEGGNEPDADENFQRSIDTLVPPRQYCWLRVARHSASARP
jgi:hypothetical protein